MFSIFFLSGFRHFLRTWFHVNQPACFRPRLLVLIDYILVYVDDSVGSSSQKRSHLSPHPPDLSFAFLLGAPVGLWYGGVLPLWPAFWRRQVLGVVLLLAPIKLRETFNWEATLDAKTIELPGQRTGQAEGKHEPHAIACHAPRMLQNHET